MHPTPAKLEEDEITAYTCKTNLQNPCHLYETLNKLDTLMHKPYNKVLLVLSYEGLASKFITAKNIFSKSTH